MTISDDVRILCQRCGLNFRAFTVTCPRCDWCPPIPSPEATRSIDVPDVDEWGKWARKQPAQASQQVQQGLMNLIKGEAP